MTNQFAPTLLLAENDSPLRDLLRLAFSQAGWQVACARDGVEALALARHNRPLVAVLNILLPKVNGLDVMRLLKKQPGCEQVPVILMSELAFRETVQQAIAAGAHDFLVKPFDLQVLLAKAQKAVRLPDGPAAAARGPQVRPFLPPVCHKPAEEMPPAA